MVLWIVEVFGIMRVSVDICSMGKETREGREVIK
ncbi:hypothetical protein Hc94105_0127 [Helicobacter cinaedi]|nr:hypothetical protein Hc94105_0127 [Helicobacter cinaedi]